jgi:hypothetical protein
LAVSIASGSEKNHINFLVGIVMAKLLFLIVPFTKPGQMMQNDQSQI